MRGLVAIVLLLSFFAGCSASEPVVAPTEYQIYATAKSACLAQPEISYTLYLGPQQSLVADLPAAGESAGNGFTQGFVRNDLKEWLGDPVATGLWLSGNVSIDIWVRSEGTPAPIVLGGAPGEGYHLFNQFGSNRSLQPAYAVEYNGVAPAAGQVDHYNETLELRPGGFVLEPGDRTRLLLTGLTLDGAMGPGQTILFGGDTPSQVRFRARCWMQEYVREGLTFKSDIAMSGNQGLLTGAVPEREGVNVRSVGLPISNNVSRLTIRLEQMGGPRDPKSDIDLMVVDADGNELWSIGSPYTDEQGVLWGPNLHAVLPHGNYVLKVNAYSGAMYEGELTVIQEWPIEYEHGDPAATS